jgi:hypothetical protein
MHATHRLDVFRHVRNSFHLSGCRQAHAPQPGKGYAQMHNLANDDADVLSTLCSASLLDSEPVAGANAHPAAEPGNALNLTARGPRPEPPDHW